MSQFNFSIGRCRFERASNEFKRNVFLEPLTKQDLVSMERDIYLDSIVSFIMIAVAIGIGFFEMHGGGYVKSWVELIPFMLSVLIFLGAIQRFGGNLSKLLNRRKYHFEGVVMKDSANSLQLLAPADSKTRLKLAEYLRDSPILMEKIGAYLKLVKNQERELSGLEAYFCCAVCELTAVDVKINDAERILEKAIDRQQVTEESIQSH